MQQSGNKAVFFDKDGVLNKLVWHKEKQAFTAPWNLDEFTILPETKQVVQRCKDNNFLRLCVTNQPDVHDGWLSISDLDSMMSEIYKLGFDDIGIALERDSIYYKPNNGIIEYFVSAYDVDRKSSYMVGDSWKDIVCGHRSQLKTIYIGKEYVTPVNHVHIVPDYVVDDLNNACKLICGENHD
jgi:D-glycero-D-manno-heptose 1,7-bisphosphate phosphatase